MTSPLIKKKQSQLKALIGQFGSLLMTWQNIVEETGLLLANLQYLEQSLTSIKNSLKRSQFRAMGISRQSCSLDVLFCEAGPRILSKVFVDREAILNQTKIFLSKLGNVLLALVSTSTEAFDLALDEVPGSFEGCVFDCEHVLKMNYLVKQHSLELERKKNVVNLLLGDNASNRSIDDWNDLSDLCLIDVNSRDLFIAANNIK